MSLINDFPFISDIYDVSMSKIMDRITDRSKKLYSNPRLSQANSDETQSPQTPALSSSSLNINQFSGFTKINQHKILLKKVKSDSDHDSLFFNNNNNKIKKKFHFRPKIIESKMSQNYSQCSIAHSNSLTDLSFLKETNCGGKTDRFESNLNCGKKMDRFETSSQRYKNYFVRCLKDNIVAPDFNLCANNDFSFPEFMCAKSQLIKLIRSYKIDNLDEVVDKSHCLSKISLDESSSLFTDNGDKPNLPCFYKENLDKIAFKINSYNPFNNSNCKREFNFEDFQPENLTSCYNK
ncbi:hypothetical protein BpHYR1_033000 [Brachionus plicatilis]|uniref:Uncharacterized protein n=1 Tax=Brachionus plicatilis TaxID=10195 RepID=A0A3M7PFM9_BRAPC|nr:hypothetical protein BpHYR1_033000 [Brachionus plicatilis]